MRPGPPTERLMGGLEHRVRVDVLRGRETLARGVPASDVLLEGTVGRGVPQRLTYSLPPDWAPGADVMHPASHYGQHSLPVLELHDPRTGESWETPLGLFLHTPATESAGRVEIDARDIAQRLAEDEDPWPSSPGAGATLRSEAVRIAADVPVAFDEPRIETIPVRRTQAWGRDRLDSLLELASMCGCAVRSGADGALHIYPLGGAGAPDLWYPPGVIVSAPPPSPPSERPVSRWIAVRESSGGDKDAAPVRTTVTVEREEPQFYPGDYGRVTRVLQSSDGASAYEAAADALSQARITGVRRTLMLPLDPRAELGDVVQATLPDGEIIVARVAACSMPLSDPGRLMRLDVDTLLW